MRCACTDLSSLSVSVFVFVTSQRVSLSSQICFLCLYVDIHVNIDCERVFSGFFRYLYYRNRPKNQKVVMEKARVFVSQPLLYQNENDWKNRSDLRLSYQCSDEYEWEMSIQPALIIDI
jgi:hypothetical protein